MKKPCLDQTLSSQERRVSENPFEARAGNQPNAGVLSQSPSSNHALSSLPKVPSRSVINALCLSQSAFSNFALYVIILENTEHSKQFKTGVQKPYPV